MEANFINGTSVNRIWSDSKSELLGVFQYEADAVMFAETKRDEDVKQNWPSDYVVSCSLTGKITLIRRLPLTADKAQ